MYRLNRVKNEIKALLDSFQEVKIINKEEMLASSGY